MPVRALGKEKPILSNGPSPSPGGLSCPGFLLPPRACWWVSAWTSPYCSFPWSPLPQASHGWGPVTSAHLKCHLPSHFCPLSPFRSWSQGYHSLTLPAHWFVPLSVVSFLLLDWTLGGQGLCRVWREMPGTRSEINIHLQNNQEWRECPLLSVGYGLSCASKALIMPASHLSLWALALHPWMGLCLPPRVLWCTWENTCGSPPWFGGPTPTTATVMSFWCERTLFYYTGDMPCLIKSTSI